jgi:hypothetical protein
MSEMYEDAYLALPDPDTEAELDHMRWQEVDSDESELVWCPRGEHGLQEVINQGSFVGHAGGRSYFVELACGCTDMDETNDVNAAY